MKFEKVNPATGAASPGYSRNNSGKVQVNHHTGHMNDGRLVNFGRGPTKGNQDYDAGQGSHREPPTSGVPSSTKIKNPDYINGGAQVRTPGGTKEFPKRGKESFNYGRGPTKGNMQ